MTGIVVFVNDLLIQAGGHFLGIIMLIRLLCLFVHFQYLNDNISHLFPKSALVMTEKADNRPMGKE